jgi:hypothetical protein
VGSAEVDPTAPAAPTGDAGAPRAETTAGAAPAGASRKPVAPTSFDVSLPAAKVSDHPWPADALVIRLQLQPPCPTGGNVTLNESGKSGRQRAEGRDQALFTVGSGSWSYRYQCERQELHRAP